MLELELLQWEMPHHRYSKFNPGISGCRIALGNWENAETSRSQRRSFIELELNSTQNSCGLTRTSPSAGCPAELDMQGARFRYAYSRVRTAKSTLAFLHWPTIKFSFALSPNSFKGFFTFTSHCFQLQFTFWGYTISVGTKLAEADAS
jgi:hypothetical protein